MRMIGRLLLATWLGLFAYGLFAVPGVPDTAGRAYAATDFAKDSRRNFMLRRACEENLPACTVSIRRQIEREERASLINGLLAGGMILLIGLAVYYTYQKNERKKKEARENLKQTLHESRITPSAPREREEEEQEKKPKQPSGIDWLDG